MKRTNPADLRKSLEVAQLYVKSGIDFVPMPVFNEDDRAKVVQEAIDRLELAKKGDSA